MRLSRGVGFAQPASAVFAVFAVFALVAGCSLNPQPLPPDQPGDASVFGAAPGVGDGSGGASDASTLSSDAAKAMDAAGVPRPVDGGDLEDAATVDASDAGPDGATSDGAADAADSGTPDANPSD